MTQESIQDEYWASQRRPPPPSGNTHLASQVAAEYREIVKKHAAYQPRSLQKFLGPSELGSPCDRQVAGKMAGLPGTNHTVDPWPSLVGTWCHEGMAECFTAENHREGVKRFLAETRVAGHPNHPGTSDLYDWNYRAVVDHKFLGESTHAKIRRAGSDPPRKYIVQILMYGEGFRRLGFRVDRVMLAAWPRTGSKLAGLYVWERPHTADDIELLQEVYRQTDNRYVWATRLATGQCTLNDIPMTPDDDECYFCPFFRAQSAHDGGPGCPGNRIDKTQSPVK